MADQLPELDELAVELIKLGYRESEAVRRLSRLRFDSPRPPTSNSERQIAQLQGELTVTRDRMDAIRAQLLTPR